MTEVTPGDVIGKAACAPVSNLSKSLRRVTNEKSAGRRPGKYAQATRLLKLLDHLRGHRYGVPVSDLAQEFSVSERQVRRDLHALVEAGYALEHETIDERAAVRLSENTAVSVRLTVRERYALMAVRRVFDVLKDTPFFEDVRSIYDKVLATLPHNAQTELSDLGDRFVYLPDGGTKDYRGKEDVLDALLTGVIRRFRVRVRYTSNTKRKAKGTLEPYAMVFYRQGLYVIGRFEEEGGGSSTQSNAARTFAVERFTEAEFIRNDRFQVPEGFAVEQCFQGAFGIYRGTDPTRVVIEFDEKARALVEARTWHPTQKISTAKGRTRLEFEASDITQVAQWVIGWGPLAHVLQPESLRDRVAKEHADAAALYVD